VIRPDVMPMENKVLVAVVLSGICYQTRALSGTRLQMFLEWLAAHCHPIGLEGPGAQESACWDWPRVEDHLRVVLGTWLETLPLPDLLWEYHLVLTEIGYWQEIGPQQLQGILESERKR